MSYLIFFSPPPPYISVLPKPSKLIKGPGALQEEIQYKKLQVSKISSEKEITQKERALRRQFFL